MKNLKNWTYPATLNTSLFIASRGFTGHEHLPLFKFVNMNGSLYDPLVGQFLNPDNYNQDAGFTQSFNRYSYCLNNPLKYSDPSGMLMRAPDEESDQAFNDYFAWMTDVRWGMNMAGGGGGGYGLPGQERNGKGLNGVYWDWESFTYRSTSNYQKVNGPVFTRFDFEDVAGLAIGFITIINTCNVSKIISFAKFLTLKWKI